MPNPEPQRVLATLQQLERLRRRQLNGKRRYERFVVRGEARIVPLDQNMVDIDSIDVAIRDLGYGGIGFLCHCDLPRASKWRVIFQHKGYAVGQQSAIVRHVRKVEDGLHLVGAQFCVDPAMLVLMGVDPSMIDPIEATDDTDGVFLAPSEVA